MSARRMVLVALLLSACGAGEAEFHRPAVFVIGMDGMEPTIVEAEMAAGRMPNFARLAAEGGYSRLGTSNPAESPVAWANFITGMDSGGNGIFDFIHREIGSTGLSLYLATAKTTDPSGPWIPIPFTGCRVPWNSGETKSGVRGKYFWEYLTERGIPATVVRIPDLYPPKETGAVVFTGMGTPDAQGAYGVSSYYTDDPPRNASELRSSIQLFPVEVREGVVETVLRGPKNIYLKLPSRRLRPPYSVVLLRAYPDVERQVARIDVGEESRVLEVGEWSDWIPVSFSLIPNLASASGMVRLYLKELSPHFRLYVSPVNVDPLNPDLPVSTPADASAELARAIGRYYTQGMAENVQANRHRVLDTGEFLDQAMLVWEERKRMLGWTLDRFEREGGFTFFYISTTDLCAHMLFQYMDEEHPMYDAERAPEYAGRLAEIYREMDVELGKVLDRVPEGTRVMVMSDHGFKPYRRQLSVNTWLNQNGYLHVLFPESQGEMPGYKNVDWFRTRAYAVGFSGIYLNLRGRETNGLVPPGEEAEKVKDDIIRGLESLTDPKSGERVVTKVYRREEIYHGPEVSNAPDLVIGFSLHYGCSDESVKGLVPRELFKDTDDAWSGSHLMDPSHVPGVLFANKKIGVADPRLIDLPVTILGEFGIVPEGMQGRRIW